MSAMADQGVIKEKKKLPEDFFFEGQLIEQSDGRAKKDAAVKGDSD